MESRRRSNAPAAQRTPAEPGGDQQAAGGALPDASRQRETAEYLAEMILELRNLARGNRLYTIMVPLEYAYYEAFGVANRVEVPAAEIDRIRELSKASQQFEQTPQG